MRSLHGELIKFHGASRPVVAAYREHSAYKQNVIQVAEKSCNHFSEATPSGYIVRDASHGGHNRHFGGLSSIDVREKPSRLRRPTYVNHVTASSPNRANSVYVLG